MSNAVGLKSQARLVGRPPSARFGSVVEQVALAAAALSVDELVGLVPELIVQSLPVDHCVVAKAGARQAEGARTVAICVHGVTLGLLVVWRDERPVCLSAAEKSELAAVAAILGLAMRIGR